MIPPAKRGTFSLRLILHGRRGVRRPQPPLRRLRARRLLPRLVSESVPLSSTDAGRVTARVHGEGLRDRGNPVVSKSQPGSRHLVSGDAGIRRLASLRRRPLRGPSPHFGHVAQRCAQRSSARVATSSRPRRLDAARARASSSAASTSSRAPPEYRSMISVMRSVELVDRGRRGQRARHDPRSCRQARAQSRGTPHRISSRDVERPPVRCEQPCSPCSTSAASPATFARGCRGRPIAGDAAGRGGARDPRRRRGRGDDAVRELTERFDGVVLDDLRGAERRAATLRSTASRRAVARRARARGRGHRRLPRERAAAPKRSTSATASSCARSRCRSTGPGCYVPGGRAVYPSTVLMTAVPARVAGVRRGRAVRAARRATGTVPARHARRGRDRRGRRGVRGRRRAGDRRDGLRHRVDPRRSTSSSGPATSTSRSPSARSPARASSACPSAFAGPSEVVVVADDTDPGRAAPPSTSIVQAEHGRDGLAWLDHLARGGGRRRSTRRSTALVDACAPPRRDRGDARRGRLRRARRRPRAGDGGRER